MIESKTIGRLYRVVLLLLVLLVLGSCEFGTAPHIIVAVVVKLTDHFQGSRVASVRAWFTIPLRLSRCGRTAGCRAPSAMFIRVEMENARAASREDVSRRFDRAHKPLENDIDVTISRYTRRSISTLYKGTPVSEIRYLHAVLFVPNETTTCTHT